ncbi:hypothetical protein SALBM311S_07022 [Streptomyces alboniger]
MAAVPEQASHLGEFLGDDSRVQAEPTGHDRQRQRLDLGQPQQGRVRFLKVAQAAQGERAAQRGAGVACGLVGVEPQPQFRVEHVALPLDLPGGRRVAYRGQQQRDPGQAGRAAAGTAGGSGLRLAGFAHAEGEGLCGQLGGRGGAGRAQVGVGEHGIPAL